LPLKEHFHGFRGGGREEGKDYNVTLSYEVEKDKKKGEEGGERDSVSPCRHQERDETPLKKKKGREGFSRSCSAPENHKKKRRKEGKGGIHRFLPSPRQNGGKPEKKRKRGKKKKKGKANLPFHLLQARKMREERKNFITSTIC